MRQLELVVDDRAGAKRLDRYLADRLPELSRTRLKGLIGTGHVSVDRATIAEAKYRVKPGQRIRLTVPRPVDPAPEAQAMPLAVLYEDADLIVVDKPAGLVVHPAPGNPDRTLVNALIAHCGASLSGIGGVRRPGIVHRLDKDTSGVLVAAKTDPAHRGLAEAFRNHDLERAYQALVWGRPSPAAGTLEGAIGRHPRARKKMTVLAEGGKPARTHYEIERRFAAGLSLLRCRLETGRTHQIRVHLSQAGHPVVGDRLYGRGRRARGRDLAPGLAQALADFPRQALHAGVLGFRHPVTGRAVRFEAPVPADLAELLDRLARP